MEEECYCVRECLDLVFALINKIGILDMLRYNKSFGFWRFQV